jgi:hypothetical protein
MPPHCDSIDGPVVKAAIRALDEGSVELVSPFVVDDLPHARIQEALGRGRSRVAHASRQYVASTWTNVIGRIRPFRPVRPGAPPRTPGQRASPGWLNPRSGTKHAFVPHLSRGGHGLVQRPHLDRPRALSHETPLHGGGERGQPGVGGDLRRRRAPCPGRHQRRRVGSRGAGRARARRPDRVSGGSWFSRKGNVGPSALRPRRRYE